MLRICLHAYGEGLSVAVTADSILLELNSIIVVPSETVYANPGAARLWFVIECDSDGCLTALLNMCCCMGLCAYCTTLPDILSKGDFSGETHFVPLTRISVSFIEIIILIFYGLYGEGGERFDYLFTFEHGLSVFITTCIFYLIYTQYTALFPKFALPLGVNIRSKWGYAYSNELSELKKIKVPLKKMPYVNRDGREISNTAEFWDESYSSYSSVTAAMFALVKGNDEIVKWLEEQGAAAHLDPIKRDQGMEIIKESEKKQD